jgi:hypothetical protein
MILLDRKLVLDVTGYRIFLILMLFSSLIFLIYMPSRHLMWDPTPPGGVGAEEQVLSGPQPYNEHSHLYY